MMDKLKAKFWQVGICILQNRDSSSSNLIKKFTDDISKYGEREERVANAYVKFNEDRKSTILRCDIEGAVRKSEGSYNATFFWPLHPLGLDFTDNDFEESERPPICSQWGCENTTTPMALGSIPTPCFLTII